jgi:hypothetical protein
LAITLQVGAKDFDMPVVLIGDGAYPLFDFIMKPYCDNGHLTDSQKLFNYKLSRARMTVENTFAKLKGAWRILQKRVDVHISRVNNIINSCCILHNYCEKKKETLSANFEVTKVESCDSIAISNIHTEVPSARVTRDKLANYFKTCSE